MRASFLLLMWVLLTFSCTTEEKRNEETKAVRSKEVGPSVLYFEELVEVDKIEHVTIRNNYGKKTLDESQLIRLKKEFSRMTLRNCCPTKPGAIYLELTMYGKIYSGYSTTGSNLIFFDGDLPVKRKDLRYLGPAFYFEMPKEMNLDNYR